MKSLKIRICQGFVLAAVIFVGAASSASWQNYEIVSQDESHVTLTVRMPRYSLDEVTIGDNTYSRIDPDDLTPFASAGQPDLPAFVVTLAVPWGARARLEAFSRSGQSVLDGVRVIPVARVEAVGEEPRRFADYLYDEDEAIYGGDSPFPQSPVWLADRGRLRHQDVVRVFISPFVYEPGSGRLHISREVTVTVGFEGGAGSRTAPRLDDRWEQIYRDVVLNYEQGRHWRAERRPGLLRSPAVTNDRVKILIKKTGVHKLAFDTASEIGFPDGVPVDEVFVYRDEFKDGTPDTLEIVETSIEIKDNDEDGFFSSGDEITFYALDLHDQLGYRGAEDLFSDDSVYWLSWGAGAHRRIGSRSGWRESPSPATPEHFSDFVHIERDSFFSNLPPVNTAIEPFDLFYWRRHNASLPFDLPGVHPDYPCSLVVNYISFYLEQESVSGSIRTLVQGCSGVMEEIGYRPVTIPSALRLSFEIEAGFFCDEGNIFMFESTVSTIYKPGHTLDWFEVLYERKFEAHEDVLTFTNGTATGEVEFGIGGFTTSDIAVLDVTDPAAPVRLEIPPENITPEDGFFNLTFRDSVGGQRRYHSYCGACTREIAGDELTLVGPPGIRDVAGNYLIVSHPNFTAELYPLIARREDQGHTIMLVTTDEVYNDFGNGMKSDVAIKRFIKQGYFAGDAEFALLVGDANVDRKGRLNAGLPGQSKSDIDYLPSHNRILVDLFFPPNWEIRPNDHWFVSLDGPDDDYPDLYLGRLSVGSTQETAGIVAKILDFETYEGTDAWKKRLLVVADDEFGKNAKIEAERLCYTGQFQFRAACDSAAIIATDFGVVPVDTVKFYLERCLADDQPAIRAAHGCPVPSITYAYTEEHCTPELVSLMNSSALLINYEGHSNRYTFTHEFLIYDLRSNDDIKGLTNREEPFIFLGFGCWLNDFQWLAELVIEDAIGEKFILNPNGGACASFASGCAESIIRYLAFNRHVIRAFFTHLQGIDPQGRQVPARILLGEAVMAALLRYGQTDFIQSYITLGDPAMIVDMGPPLISVSVNDSTIDESYLYQGETFDTLDVVADIRDEEAIMAVTVEIVEDGVVTTVPPDEYSVVALTDTGLARSRAYEVAYEHLPLLGDYALRISAEDYADKVSSFDMQIATGSSKFFADGMELADGEQLVFGQHLEILLTRPVAFTEDDIEVFVDSIAGSVFADYKVEMKDGAGKQWQVSFVPSLTAGDHIAKASVQGFSADRRFEYVPAQFVFFVNGKRLYNGDYVSSPAEFVIRVRAEGEITPEDIEVDLDGLAMSPAVIPDSSWWRVSFETELEPDVHDLTITLFGVSVARTFEVTSELLLIDVSAFPNPFSSEIHFLYTLSRDAREVDLAVFTVSGREVLKARLDPYAGYNDFMWDGRDSRGSRIANGTYLYRITVKSDSGEREFTGWVVKLE